MGDSQWLPRRRQTPGRKQLPGWRTKGSGCENVVGAILFGTYWFARIVNELSVHSQLTSLETKQ